MESVGECKVQLHYIVKSNIQGIYSCPKLICFYLPGWNLVMTHQLGHNLVMFLSASRQYKVHRYLMNLVDLVDLILSGKG